MADRKAHLEEKKAKLQALQEDRERRKMEKLQKDEANVCKMEVSRHRLHLQELHYKNIKSLKKTVEIRTGDEEKRKIHVGDIIDFFYDADKPNETFACWVKEIVEEKSFREALEAVGYRNALPGCKNINEAVKVYYGIPGYLAKEELGVLAFCIEPVD